MRDVFMNQSCKEETVLLRKSSRSLLDLLMELRLWLSLYLGQCMRGCCNSRSLRHNELCSRTMQRRCIRLSEVPRKGSV